LLAAHPNPKAMKKFSLYCKSYRNDVLRVKRLAESVARFNVENIPFFISVPLSDVALFQGILAGHPLTIINDEEIIRSNPALNSGKLSALPGSLSQQIIKSEFWRLTLSESYLCLDSDCVFIRPFKQDDFISPEGYPYTIVHEAKELLQFATNHSMKKVCDNFHQDRQKMMDIVGREGHHYDFGPAPLLWSNLVWRALDEQFLKPRGMNFYDAIVLFPGEIQWYGEAMLKYAPFPLIPVEPFFRVYHYEQQFAVAKRQGETIERLAKNYLGVCYQSNWENKTDFVKKPISSRIARWVRRNIFKRHA
jgi:hypothetical protein